MWQEKRPRATHLSTLKKEVIQYDDEYYREIQKPNKG
jgi:hypothetical protein